MKIAILGGTESRKLAPLDDPSWEKWALGNQMHWYEGNPSVISRIFEIHNDLFEYDERLKARADNASYAEWLSKFGIPMVVGTEFPVKADHIETFPFDEVRPMLGGDYLTSTPAYMVGYALARFPATTDIGFWGIDMAVDDREYFYEQPVIKEWIGYCKGRGIRVHMPDTCPLGAPTYFEGITGNRPQGVRPFTVPDFEEVIALHEKKVEEIDAQTAQLTIKKAMHNGAIQAYTRMKAVARARWGGQELPSLKETMRLT